MEEIIKIIEEELKDIELKQIRNKANSFNVTILDSYAVTLRDEHYILEGERNSLVRLKNKISEVKEIN